MFFTRAPWEFAIYDLGLMTRRFVVQEHTTIESVHWDLMLEQDGVLTTFRLESEPLQCLTGQIRAVKIFDHPLRFLTYEGPVQKGTGKVRIVDSGQFRRRERSDGLWGLDFDGAVLRGDFTLTHIKDAEWQFEALQLGGQ